MRVRKTLAAIAIGAATLAFTSGVASASHQHWLVTPGNDFVVVAQGQNSITSGPGCHQFHDNVHKGVAAHHPPGFFGGPLDPANVDDPNPVSLSGSAFLSCST